MLDHPLGRSINRRLLCWRGAAVAGAALAASRPTPAGVHAQEEAVPSILLGVLDRGTVRVGTGSTNPPWHFEDESGRLVGFDIEMGRLLAKGLFDDPEKAEFVVQEADARIPNVGTGKVDVIFQFMTVTAARAQAVEFTIPYYREAAALLFRSDSPHSSAAELAGKKAKIAILQNTFAEDLVHEAVPDAEVLQFDSIANSFLALDSGRVDATVADLSTARWQAAQDPGRYKAGIDSWRPSTYAAAVKRGDHVWLHYVDTVLHEAMTGVEFATYRAAFKTYFGVDLPTPKAGFPFEYTNWAPGTGYGP